MEQRIIAIVGQTATGKSQLGIVLAKKFQGSIVSADSRQVYRGLDIGSGKVTKREQRIVPHHLLDVVHPKQQYTVARYIRDGKRALHEISRRGRIPIVVGGTGFWIDTLLQGMNVPAIRPNSLLRKTLAKQKTPALFTRLQRLDPQRAKTIDRHNPVRIIRALEIVLTTKKPVPSRTSHAEYDVLWVGLRQPVQQLRKRIHLRLMRRMRAGLVAEVRGLLQGGVPAQRLLDLGLEYRYVTRYVQHDLTREDMLVQLETAIMQYAKRQRTWFVRNSNIHWVTSAEQAAALTKKFLHL